MDTKKLLSLHWDHAQNKGYTLFGTYAISYLNYSCAAEEQRCDLYFYGFMVVNRFKEYGKWNVKSNIRYNELEVLAKNHFETVLEQNMRYFTNNILSIQNRDYIAQKISADIKQIMDIIESVSENNKKELMPLLNKRQAELDRLGLERI
jgi:hypothetical protein